MRTHQSILVWLSASITVLALSPRAHAYNAECNPIKLKEANEKHAGFSLCSVLEPKDFETCVYTMRSVGVGAFLAGMFANGEGSARVLDAVARANMSRLRNTFSSELVELTRQVKGQSPSFDETRRLLAEFKKHPRLYSNQVANVSTGLRLKQLGSYLKKFGALAVVLSYVEATMFTPPEDCRVLDLSGIQPEDKKYVDFGMNCTRHINPDLFTQSLEQQVLITQRSPHLCKALLNYEKDLDKQILKIAKTAPPAPVGQPQPPTPESAR